MQGKCCQVVTRKSQMNVLNQDKYIVDLHLFMGTVDNVSLQSY